MTRPTVFGPTYSVYTRIARLALEEKGAPYDLVDVAMLSGAHKRPHFLQRNPFGKLPAFAHDTLSLYEPAPLPGMSIAHSPVRRCSRRSQRRSLASTRSSPLSIPSPMPA